jgi:AcrR family transcriptional regulator
MVTSSRMSATERRKTIVAIALQEFAARGYFGTSVEAIARQVGVSQPYLFQIFTTKKRLFVETVQACFERARTLFAKEGVRAHMKNPDPASVLEAMGRAYGRSLGDRDLFRLQFQAFAACDDPDIRAVVAEEMKRSFDTVAQVSGADAAALEAWFAKGMLLNALAAIAPPKESARPAPRDPPVRRGRRKGKSQR